jgi:hypothetical protein
LYFKIEDINIYEKEGNPCLQISNIKDNSLFIEVFSTSGKLILEKTTLENNKIKIDHYPSSLYIIKVFDKDNRSKLFKFLKT